MTHDVFICHSSKDKTVADAVTATLEGRGIRCWVSPRDVVPGTDYASSIVDAITTSSLMVLVFSSHSNRSGHVGREIERAVSHGIPILPFRVEAVEPSPALEYYISVAHWLDAFTPPLEEHLEHLAGTVEMLLQRAATAPPPVPVPDTAPAADEVPAVPVPSPGPEPEPEPEPGTEPEPSLHPALVGVVAATGQVAPAEVHDQVHGGSWPMHWADQPIEPVPLPPPPTPLAHSTGTAPAGRRRLVLWAALAALVLAAVAGGVLLGGGGSACDPGPGADLAGCELSGRDLAGADLHEADLSGADLTDATLTDADLTRADLRGADLGGADLTGAELPEAFLDDADLAGADLSGADLQAARLRDADLEGADLDGADLTAALLNRADLSGLDLTSAVLADAVLAEAALDGADLTGADLRGVDVSSADLTGAALDGADLTGAAGLTDEQLVAALGVAPDALAGVASERGIRLDSVEAILAAAATVRDGATIEGAPPYEESGAFHPVVVLGPTGAEVPAWAAATLDGWAPTGVRFTELVVVAGDETWEVIEVCEYNVGGVAAPPITRYQARTSVQILAAADGRVVAERSFLGTEPRQCQPNEPYDLTELRGDPPDLAGEALLWVIGYVHPPGT